MIRWDQHGGSHAGADPGSQERGEQKVIKRGAQSQDPNIWK